MSAWWNLFKKEYRMTKYITLVMLAMLIGGGLWAVYSSREHLGIIMAPTSLILMFALFYPPVYLTSNIYKELKKTPHLWLHCPQSAWMLLSAKLGMAVVILLAILVVHAVFTYSTLFIVAEHTGIAVNTLALLVTELGVYIIPALIGVSIYMAAWGTLMAVTTASARNLLGRLSWLAGLATFIAATWGMDKLQETWLFERLTQWGSFTVRPLTINEVLPLSVGGADVYAGQIFMGMIITIALFALSAWLIDNKVEV